MSTDVSGMLYPMRLTVTRCRADCQLSLFEVHAGVKKHNASQLYDHFPPKHLVYRLQRQQMRQAGDTM